MTIENNRGRDDEVPKHAGLPASRAALLRCQIVAAPMTSRHETPTRSPSGNFRTILVGLIVTLTLSALDQTIVGPALPQIASEFGGLGHLAWIVMAFMLASTVTMPLYGKASDLYGRRPLFVVSIVVFLIGSALCGLAGSMIQLILFRGLQGLGAGGLMTLAQITIADIMPPRERGRYQGLFAAVFAVCSIAGPLLGGVITDVLSWRWLFYVNLPIGGAALALILLALPRSGKRVAHHLDYVGALLLTAGTVCLLVLMTWGGTVYPWRSAVIAGLGGSAAVLLLLFVQCERVASEPLLPMRLFRNRVFVIAVLVTALTAMALFGAFVFLPTYFQLVLGLSPSTAGLLTAPLMGGLIVSSVIGGRIVSATGRYKMFPVIGLAVAAGALIIAMIIIAASASLIFFEIALVVLGAGLGLVMPNLTVAIQNAVPRDAIGISTSTSSFMRSLGGSFGVAVAGAIVAARLGDSRLGGAAGQAAHGVYQFAELPREATIAAFRYAFSETFLVGAVIVAGAFVCVLFLPDRPLRSGQRTDAGTPETQ